jgi:hypothetical protein
MIRNLSFIVFLLAFLHVSILVGAIEKTPVVGPSFKAGIAQDDRLYVSLPMKAYGAVGGFLWSNESVSGIIKEIYSKIFKEGIQRLKPNEFKGLADIYLWNKVVLAGLGVFIVLSFMRRRR